MSKLATFTTDVAKAMFDFTRQNPRNAKAELAEQREHLTRGVR